MCLAGEVKLQELKPEDKHQQWRIDGRLIVNRVRPEMCLDIKKARDKNGAEVVEYKYHGGTNEHWSKNYV